MNLMPNPLNNKAEMIRRRNACQYVIFDKLKRSGIVMFHNHSKRSDAIKSHANINAMKNKTINVSSLS
jgi:hypothetical protein